MIWLILLLALNMCAVGYFATRCTKLDIKVSALRDEFYQFKGGFDAAVFKQMASVVDEVREEVED